MASVVLRLRRGRRSGLTHFSCVGVCFLWTLGCAAISREIVIPVVPRAAALRGPAPSVADAAGAKAVSADEIYTVYSLNLNTGANPDQRFLNRWLVVTGVLNGISRSLPPHVYLELRTHDPEGFVYAELTPEAGRLPATLQPGMSVRLLCRGDGMMIGSPVLRECRLG